MAGVLRKTKWATYYYVLPENPDEVRVETLGIGLNQSPPPPVMNEGEVCVGILLTYVETRTNPVIWVGHLDAGAVSNEGDHNLPDYNVGE